MAERAGGIHEREEGREERAGGINEREEDGKREREE